MYDGSSHIIYNGMYSSTIYVIIVRNYKIFCGFCEHGALNEKKNQLLLITSFPEWTKTRR